MKIIKYGHIKPNLVKCNHCGAVLEYIPRDLQTQGKLIFLSCSVCGKPIVRDSYGNRFMRGETE